MNKTIKILTISFGVIGSLLLCCGLIGLIFSLNSIKENFMFRLSLPFLFAFFTASAFVFTKTNHIYKFARGFNALTMSLAVSLVTLEIKSINPNFVFLVIGGSFLFYNICDILFRKIKLPQIFIVIPMILIFAYELINYSKDNSKLIIISTGLLTILFVFHLIYKSLPIIRKEITSE